MENRNETLNKLEELACEYERKYGGCTQCVLGAFKTVFGSISDDVFKAGTGLAGGIGLTGNNCGAFTGGVIALSTYIGRDFENFSDPGRIRFESFRIARKLIQRFIEEYGSINCRDIQTKIMGRYFNLQDAGEHAEFVAAGGHDDKCPVVCGKAARWAAEILEEEKLI